MKRGLGVFGKAWEVSLKNDPHAECSIDWAFMEQMMLLDEESCDQLYSVPINVIDMRGHELFDFAQQFKGKDDRETIRNVLDYTSGIVSNFDIDFELMLFGGTEKQIIERGTDWCADITRVGAVLLQCLGIPCRIVTLANLGKAYNGHVIGEAYYEDCYGLVDFTFGYQMYDMHPISARDVMQDPSLLNAYPEDYKGTYSAIAINEYDPMDPDNDYTVTPPNEYTKKVIYTEHHDKWFMGEDK